MRGAMVGVVTVVWALGCGNDHQNKVTQLEEPRSGASAFDVLNACADEDAVCEEEEESPCSREGAPADCCIADVDCDDGDPRTLDVCDGATCVHTPNPDACERDADCDDDEVCTVDSCDVASGVCGHRGTIEPDCCIAGSTAFADFDRDTLQGLYVTDNLQTGIFWRTDGARSTSGSFALYCGDPATRSYLTDDRVKSSATTRPLMIPKGGETTLEFDLYKATRTARNWDVFQVMALRDDGLFPLWTSKSLKDGTTEGGWIHVSVPLTDYAGTELQLRFVFDSVDVSEAPFEGVYIDTLGLTTTCE